MDNLITKMTFARQKYIIETLVEWALENMQEIVESRMIHSEEK
jgi:hypothetical protein